MTYSGLLAQNTSKDTICVSKEHYKDLLKIAASEKGIYQELNQTKAQVKIYSTSLDSVYSIYTITSTKYDSCLDKSYNLATQLQESKSKIKRKNKKLIVGYGVISSWIIYQGIRIYLTLKP